ncbi:MAG: acyl-CoA thioesterase [Gammaproteobacteria bacterium]|nr:acyl-CoA thioesterase [Gammaproteobacteria bacterium]NIR58137.1 acyl-CoA thioesterase [Gammaproteobacteria bacterium]NIR88133.1 acyl-CoA thioesterase [Gammaproteobacteria bacterium]
MSLDDGLVSSRPRLVAAFLETPVPIYLETFRATVAPADCDHLGHMNVQHYFRAVSDGMFAVMVRLGLTPEEIRRRGLSFAVVRAETEFHHELFPGDVIALESTILKVGGRSATFHHRLRNLSTDDLVMSTEFKCVLLQLGKKQAAVIPRDIRDAAAEHFATEI